MLFAASSTTSSEKGRWLGWKVISLLDNHRPTAGILGLLVVVASALDIAVPFLTKGLIDKILHSLGAQGRGSMQALVTAAVAIFAVTASTRLLRSFYNYRLVKTASQAEDEAKNAAFTNFLKLDTAFHGSVNTGEIVGALDRGGTAIFVILNEILGQNLVPPILIATGVLTALVIKNIWIALIVFAPLPAYLIAISRLGYRMQSAEQQVSKAFENVTKESYDISSNVRLVKKFGREEQEANTQRGLLHIARDKHYTAERLWALTDNIQGFIATAGRVSVIALSGFLVLTRRCTVGDFVLFIAMQDMIYGPISQLSIILPKLRRNLSRAERLFEILEERPDISDAPNAPALLPVEHSVEFKGVSFRYADSDRWALKDLNLRVPVGSTVALIGISGSGKSTLMNLLQRLYDPQYGSILIDGRDIRNVTQQSLRDQIAVVPQEIDLFSRSVLANIGYGRDCVSVSDVQDAARMAQAHDFIQRTEDGYETQVGERGAKLSGGERQRIGIARAIARNPKILILDEATSHLDNESERLIQVAMERVTRGRTSFIIAHRLSTVRKADIVVVFNEGGIEAIGSHDELWNTSPTYRKLNGLHVASRPRPKVAAFAGERRDTGRSALPMAVGE
ncbi:MAG: ABC transporter ATP-binding protein/permease [Acidobacteriota bacterium]|nr:ABC transporter ATP-binding protein/permease [Acidobacteriota bacterium]